jgi:hypothetical protein
MDNLQPLSAYTDDITRVWARTGTVTGVAFGAVMAIGVGWMLPSTTGPAATIASETLALFGGGGSFGYLCSRSMARSWQTMRENIYEGKPPFEVYAPSSGYTHRLPASLRTSDRFAIGGVVFIGPRAIAFVPHAMNLPAHRTTIVVPVGDTITVDTFPQRSTFFRRLWCGALPELLQVRSGGEQWSFLVPRPQDTSDRLRDVVNGRTVVDRA